MTLLRHLTAVHVCLTNSYLYNVFLNMGFILEFEDAMS